MPINDVLLPPRPRAGPAITQFDRPILTLVYHLERACVIFNIFEHVKHCNAVIRSIPNFRRKPIDQSALESHFGSRRDGVGASKSRRARESKIKGKADSACVSTILHRRCHVRDANKFTYQCAFSIAESDWNGMSPSLDICRIIMPFSFAAIRSIPVRSRLL